MPWRLRSPATSVPYPPRELAQEGGGPVKAEAPKIQRLATTQRLGWAMRQISASLSSAWPQRHENRPRRIHIF
jgi:hypothetical protein